MKEYKRAELFCSRDKFTGNEDLWYKLNAGKSVKIPDELAQKVGHFIVPVEEAQTMSSAKVKKVEPIENADTDTDSTQRTSSFKKQLSSRKKFEEPSE